MRWRISNSVWNVDLNWDGSINFGMMITSSIYGSRSYMKWRYGGVRHGALAGKHRDIAFGVLALLMIHSESYSESLDQLDFEELDILRGNNDKTYSKFEREMGKKF
jgi:hypothetical protein